MISKTLNTRLKMKIDTYENWISNDPILLLGEIAFATISVAQEGSINSVPSVLMKCGNGTNKFSELDWVYGKASNVYSWALQSTKPSYAATEIEGLETFIAGEIQDTDTTYTITKVNDYQYKLMSKVKGDETFSTEVAVIDIPNDTDAITALQTLVGNTAVATQIANAITDLDLANTYEAKGSASAAEARVNATITAIKDGSTIDSFKDVEDALAEKQSVGDYPTKTEAQSYADAKDDAIVAAKKAGDDAQTDVDALEAYVGTFTALGDETTVIEYVDAKIDAIPAQIDYSVAVTESAPDGYAKAYTFAQNGSTIATVNIPKDMVVSSGTVVTDPEGQATGTYLKLILANANEDEIFINVGDLIEYVTSGSATGDQIMIGIDEDHKVTATLSEGSVTLAQLHTDVQTEIAKAHTHINKALLDTYTQTEVDLADAVAKKHSHENATVLDGITADDITNWNGKANDSDLAAVAKTGNVNDLLQTDGDYLIFDCGTSSAVI